MKKLSIDILGRLTAALPVRMLGILAVIALPLAVAAAAADESAVPQETPRADEIPRDPFWPVGYVPPPPKPVDDGAREREDLIERHPPDWEAASDLLNIQGTFRTRGRHMASINNRIVETGNVIGVRLPPWIYQWRITAIDRYEVVTTPLEAVLIGEHDRVP